MIRKRMCILIGFLLVISIQSFAQDRHLIFTEILNKYVNEGHVNYESLKNDSRLNQYLNILSQTDPDTIDNDANKIAFWINAYNAYTLKIIIDNYPVESINDLHSGGLIIGSIFSSTIWDKDFVVINNKNITLNDIEHEILRKKFNEPRIHFALVCASISCPPLRNEAYEGYKLEEQLNSQGKIFLNDKSKNFYNLERKEANISKIFDWFEEDFGENDEEVLLFIQKFLSAVLSNNIKSNISDWDISYNDYNWNLNK